MITDLYQNSLRALHADDKKWGNTAERASGTDVAWMLSSRPYIRTMLDFGSGKGRMKTFVNKWFPKVEVTEYDPGIEGKDTLPSGTFDLVFSCDVLEHVEPEAIDDTIAILAEKTRSVMYHNIACYRTGHAFKDGPYKGQDLHLIHEKPSQWAARFKRVLAADTCMQLYEITSSWRRSNRRDDKTRCTLVYERVG